jgi:multiple sugar transport system substrate-binding protein
MSLCVLFMAASCSKGAAQAPAAATAANPAQPYAGVKLSYATSATQAVNAETQALIELVKKETGIIVEPMIFPDQQEGTVDKILVGLMNGQAVDIIYGATPNLRSYYNAGVLTDLTDLSKKQKYDIQKVYGDYLAKWDGTTWALPAFADIWLTLINKDVFDEMGVPYPTADNWTWEKYVETAQKLTDPGKGIYGGLMLDYDCYNWMYGRQLGADFYKVDGSSNADDPRYKQGVEWLYNLGNNLKVQPSYVDVHSTQVPWDAFGSQTPYRYGMFVCGGWTTYLLDRNSYPRDWKAGILPMPYPAGQQKSTMVVNGCYAIPTTSKNKEAALAALKVICEKQYTLGQGRVPARVDLTQAEINEYVNNELAKPFVTDGISTADFQAAWFDPKQLHLDEKPTGAGGAEIKVIWQQQTELYAIGQQSLEQTMSAIKEQSDKAIKEN